MVRIRLADVAFEVELVWLTAILVRDVGCPRFRPPDFPKLQEQWHKNLQQFVTDYPSGSDTP